MEQQHLRISMTIGDVFDIPKFGVVLTLSVELANWTQLPEDWRPSLLRHAGIDYRVEIFDRFRMFVPGVGPQAIGISIGQAAPRSRFKAGDPVELR